MKKRLLKKVGITILVLIVLLNIMAAFHAHRFTTFYESKEEKRRFNPDSVGFLEKSQALLFGVKSYKKKIDSVPSFPYDTVLLKTEDGLSLEAWYSKGDSAVSSNTTVVLFHGHGGNKASVLREAEVFYKMHYRVLLVDFRAHGNSDGNTCTIGYDEAKDVKAAYDHAKSNTNDIIFWGISLGAAAEMKALNDYKLQLKALIVEMPFGRLQGTVRARCRLLGVPPEPTSTLLTFWGSALRGFPGFEHNPEDYAKKINCAVLLQWGVNDNRVSRQETETIYKNLATRDKTLVTYSNSGHQSLCVNEYEKWKESVAAFLDRSK